ncbi:hypothetical protein EYF80_027413 [Liparis tanakae]|uniref:Uncharacterized protein n=1 Tax=Liparis tanakae TaxID=230148 RepID=A0A4Z2HCA1_9TELE|nr:hypothetical protein EYF80_027413 [Liparis tanakae]
MPRESTRHKGRRRKTTTEANNTHVHAAPCGKVSEGNLVEPRLRQHFPFLWLPPPLCQLHSNQEIRPLAESSSAEGKTSGSARRHRDS